MPIEGLLCSLSLDVLELPLFSPPEQIVFKHKIIIILFDFMKIIHVQLKLKIAYLSNETREVAMPEVLGENLSGEGEHILDNKTDAIFLPADHVLKLRMLW